MLFKSKSTLNDMMFSTKTHYGLLSSLSAQKSVWRGNKESCFLKSWKWFCPQDIHCGEYILKLIWFPNFSAKEMNKKIAKNDWRLVFIFSGFTFKNLWIFKRIFEDKIYPAVFVNDRKPAVLCRTQPEMFIICIYKYKCQWDSRWCY